MSNQLSKEQKQICDATGTPYSRFLAEEAGRGGTTGKAAFSASGTVPLSFTTIYDMIADQFNTFLVMRSPKNLQAAHGYMRVLANQAAAQHLTADEVKISESTDTGLAAFAVAKHARITGQQGSRQYTERRSGSSFRGAVDRDVAAALDDNMTAEECLAMADKDIQSFLAKPNDLEALQFLISAESWIVMAMKKAGAARRQATGE
jgi:hypothetical protein